MKAKKKIRIEETKERQLLLSVEIYLAYLKRLTITVKWARLLYSALD